jgi:hypothetical protein
MKKFLVLFALLFTLLINFAVAAPIPAAPANCFTGKSYCVSSDVVRLNDGNRAIKIVVHMDPMQTRYNTVEELQARYFDFAQWPSYVADSSNIQFQDSEEGSMTLGGKEVITHRHTYTAKAPWPVSKMEVVDLVYYKMEKRPDTVLSTVFDQVPGFSKREGLKHNSGELHLYQDAKGSLKVYFTTTVTPSLDILPNVAKSFIQNTILDVIKGMFEL